MSEDNLDLLIIGGGPAGLTAGIYAARSGLKAVLLDKGMCGGMAATSPWIENFPGFEGISGMELMEKMRKHAEENLEIVSGADVNEIVSSGHGFEVKARDKSFECSAVIIATGADHKKLGVSGEGEYLGRGVSYCATCDGAFFKGKKVVVVGGGNNGATEALHLKNIGCEVTLIHRRDTLRADKYLQDQMFSHGVEFILNSTLEKIDGGTNVETVQIKDKTTGELIQLEVDGVFISIGEKPNTELAKQLNVALTPDGYIVVDKKQRTNIERTYSAGDVTGGLRQIITACAEGAIAAMSAYEDLKTPYWAQK